MSSSRSIAAARNRRAGGDPQPVQRSRPNTSIASHAAFSQQPMQQPQQPSQNRRIIGQQQQQQQRTSQVVPVNKISISDAIGLITIRLGRVEQYMQQLQEEGGGISSVNSENIQLVDKDVLRNLTDRVYTLENKPGSNDNKMTFLENEVKEIKMLLSKQIAKWDQFISETQEKFLDVDAAFFELEKKMEVMPNDIDEENIQLNVEENKEDVESTEDQSTGPTFTSVDLKNMIQEELANSQL